MEFQFEIVFWFCAALLAYVYIGYPVLVGILATLFPQPGESPDGKQPCVSIIISAYNEAPVIAAKIENSLALEFPAERLELCKPGRAASSSESKTWKERGVELRRSAGSW